MVNEVPDSGTSFPDSRTYKRTESAPHVSEIDTGTISVRIQADESEDHTGFEKEAQSPASANFLSETSGYRTVTRLERSFGTDNTISEFALAMILGDGIGVESFSAWRAKTGRNAKTRTAGMTTTRFMIGFYG